MESIRFLVLRLGVYFLTGYLLIFLYLCIHLHTECFENFSCLLQKEIYPLIFVVGIIFTESIQIIFNFIFKVYKYLYSDSEEVENLYPWSNLKTLKIQHFKSRENNPTFLFSEFNFSLSLFFGNLSFIGLLILLKIGDWKIIFFIILCFILSIVFRIQANKFLIYSYQEKNTISKNIEGEKR